ncbi:hypothetical protein F444_16483 [Phytophthora nicotianae P1976]|uniref:Uncharacterized protein n=1 Tax=Phytophthora nicotianae P1976 TaxID=1317066 RepID=A0A080ZI95_PHYNI|nr:hypothetical protein F444_16483 [Phytophthora nicotianae P1976]
MEQAKSTAEKEAKSVVRRHYAEENAAHEKLETRLLQTMEEFKKTTVATALLHVDEHLRSFVIQQMAKGRDVKSQGAGQYAIKRVMSSDRVVKPTQWTCTNEKLSDPHEMLFNSRPSSIHVQRSISSSSMFSEPLSEPSTANSWSPTPQKSSCVKSSAAVFSSGGFRSSSTDIGSLMYRRDNIVASLADIASSSSGSS